LIKKQLLEIIYMNTKHKHERSYMLKLLKHRFDVGLVLMLEFKSDSGKREVEGGGKINVIRPAHKF